MILCFIFYRLNIWEFSEGSQRFAIVSVLKLWKLKFVSCLHFSASFSEFLFESCFQQRFENGQKMDFQHVCLKRWLKQTMAGILYIFTRSDIFRLTLVPDIIVLINDEFRSSGCLKSIIFKTLLENKTQFQKLFSSNFGNNFFFGFLIPIFALISQQLNIKETII